MNYSILIEDLYKKAKSYNPFVIAKEMNITIKYAHFKYRPYGKTSYPNGFTIILLAETIKNTPYEFFICAHELLHALHHKNFCIERKNNIVLKSKMEHEANSFAAYLTLRDFEEKYSRPPSNFKEISTIYKIPSKYMDYFF